MLFKKISQGEKKLLQAINCGVVVFTSDGKPIFANASAENILGSHLCSRPLACWATDYRPLPTLVQKKHYQVIDKKDLNFLQDHPFECLLDRGGKSSFLWLRLRCYELSQHSRIQVMNVEDITELKKLTCEGRFGQWESNLLKENTLEDPGV